MKVPLLILSLVLMTWFRLASAIECSTSPKNSMGQLKQSLLCSYDRSLRPVKNDSQSITITTRLHVKSYYFEEHTSRLTIYSWTPISWVDEHLTWNKDQYDGIDEVLLSSFDIWIPDISLYNSDNGQSIVDHAAVNCAVDPTGKVACVVPIEYTAHCRANYQRWPYDKQTCKLFFGSWMSPSQHLDYDKEKLQVVFKDAQPNPNWKMLAARVNYSVYNASNQSFPTIQYSFDLERHEGVDEIVVVIPACLLIIMNLMSLVMDGSQRLIIICLNIICHVLYIQHLAWSLPHNGDTVPDVLVFFRNSLAICALVLVESRIVQALLKLQANVPTWIDGSIKVVTGSRFSNVLLLKVPYEKKVDEEATDDAAILVPDSGNEDINRRLNNPQPTTMWKTFAVVLDRLLLIFFLFVYVIMILSLIPFDY